MSSPVLPAPLHFRWGIPTSHARVKIEDLGLKVRADYQQYAPSREARQEPPIGGEAHGDDGGVDPAAAVDVGDAAPGGVGDDDGVVGRGEEDLWPARLRVSAGKDGDGAVGVIVPRGVDRRRKGRDQRDVAGEGTGAGCSEDPVYTHRGQGGARAVILRNDPAGLERGPFEILRIIVPVQHFHYCGIHGGGQDRAPSPVYGRLHQLPSHTPPPGRWSLNLGVGIIPLGQGVEGRQHLLPLHIIRQYQ